MSSSSSWSNNGFDVSPTFDGINTLLERISKPPELTSLGDVSDHWISALLAMSAYNMHRDGNHLDTDKGFHPLTLEHYRTGVFEGMNTEDKKRVHEDRKFHLTRIHRTIYDLCTLLDQLSGGSTIVLHHPGATAPNADLSMENISANVYLNPKVLYNLPELHVIAAELVQSFIERWAIVIAQKFKERHIAHQWKQDVLEQQPLASAPHRDSHPLIPQPCDLPSGSCFEFIGQAPGSLAHPLLSHFPQTSGVTAPKIVAWRLQQVPLSNRPSHNAPRAIQPNMNMRLSDERADEETLGVSYADTLQVYAESLPPSVRASNPHLPTENRYIPPSVRARILIPAQVTASLATEAQTSSPGASLLPVRSSHLSTTPPALFTASTPRRLRSFGQHTKDVLRQLKVLDTYHEVCFLISEAYLDDVWSAPCKYYRMSIIIPHCSAQARRHLIHNSARRKAPKLTREQHTSINERRCDKHDQEDVAVEEVLEYIQNKAMELATHFRKSPRRYLEHFYIGSALRRQKQKKTSAWSAFMHFKGKETNQGKDNVRKLVKRASDYHDLSAEELKQLVAAFDEEKEAARHRPPNLSVKTRNAECSNSFKAIVDEVEALKQRIGTEALVVLVRGTCDLNIEPKVHFTSSAVEQYLRTATRKHAMEFACKLEGYVISGDKAKQTIRGGMQAGLHASFISLSYLILTHLINANFEYLCYEQVVQKFLVKVVGWTHSDWANPSDLKGGIEALEALADTIKAKTCKFVKITWEEANKRLERIAAGETLMPNMEKGTSLSAEPSEAPSQTPVQQSPITSSSTTATS
ncbi:hypothetical protein F4604DRAFT_1598931 [Suillus subluteus]|nr:hypothetical protein F4604DRAFT_1598931 [Suillus subluteus]